MYAETQKKNSYKTIQYTAIIPDQLTIFMYQLLNVNCHNKLSDLQERSYGMSCFFLIKTNISLSSYKHGLKEYIVANGFPII